MLPKLSDIGFNAQFLIQLNAYDRKLRHLSTDSNGWHLRLRLVLLRQCKDDIKTDGLEAAQKKWQHFIGGIK